MTWKSHTYIYQDCVNRISCGLSIYKECVLNEGCNKYRNTLEVKSKNMNLKELKMGDEVEVLISKQWEKRIFIKDGRNDRIICVKHSDENKYNSNSAFNTMEWEREYWRIPKEKTYRPFTFEERDQLRGKWVKLKPNDHDYSSSEFLIERISREGIYLNGCSSYFSYEAFFKLFVFLDGSPVGILEE